MADKLKPMAASRVRASSGANQTRLLAGERLSDRLAAELIQGIERGDLQEGQRLPTEAQLSATHGVSRSVVREAVQHVRARGLLRSRQGSGVFVTAAPSHQPLAFDATVLESMDAVVQVMELRRVLEGEMAALAAQRCTRAQLADLRRAVKAIDEATASGHDGVRQDLAFHRAIGQGTGNPQFSLLLAFLEQYLMEAMRVTKGNEARHAEFMQQVREEHRQIVDAVASRDPQAARAAAIEHLCRGEQRLIQGGVIAPSAARSPAAAQPAKRSRTSAMPKKAAKPAR